MSDTKFGAWSAPQTSLSIEYSLVAIEEIRQAVAEGFQRFARGGIEVGGVLYGTYENGVVRILAVREIACEHARGPSFILSEDDRELLAEQWERDRDDPRLSGFGALGFYVSHTRSEVTLLPADVEFFNEFFPDPHHVALVIRPGRAGAMRAGFFRSAWAALRPRGIHARLPRSPRNTRRRSASRPRGWNRLLQRLRKRNLRFPRLEDSAARRRKPPGLPITCHSSRPKAAGDSGLLWFLS